LEPEEQQRTREAECRLFLTGVQLRGGGFKMKLKRLTIVVVLLTVIATLSAQCVAAPTPEKVVETVVVKEVETVVVKETVEVMVEGTPQIVEKEVIVTATPAPEPEEAPEGQPVYGGTITIGFPSDIASFDPPVMWGPQEEAAIQLVYNGLYRWKYGTTELEPEIAADMPQVSEDGSVWTIPLRQDVKFSNGEPLTAHDVKYTWDRKLDDETGGWATPYYTAIKGAPEALAGETEGVEGITVLDDYTIQFELAEPIAYFDKLLAMQWTYVMNQEHVEEVGEDIARIPLGAGPYMLTEYEPAVRAVFEKNPHYFREDEPYADRVIIDLSVDPSVAALKIERGEIDAYLERIPPLEYQELVDNPNFKGQAIEQEWLNTFFIPVNAVQEGLEDLRVRQAIAHCLDREALIKAVPAGLAIPANTILPPGDTLYYNEDQPIYEHDVEKAKELLAEAGYPDGISFPVVSANYYPWDKFAEAVQGQLAQCGINVELTLGETAAWYEWNASETNGIVFMHWPYEIPDAAYVLDGGFTEAAAYPDSCCNWTWYWTPEIEDKLAAARVETDPVKRGQMYQELDEMLAYDLVLWIPLWHPIEWYAISENLGGYKPPLSVHPRMVEPQYYWSKSGE
jgi:ABC-type transport system substrate-binding protein